MPARFSYIDAKGKEVEIGGTAQLMQRIRLGAIDGSTQLYDAASDKWAPAEDHPIYKELAATVEEERGPAAGPPEAPAEPGEDGVVEAEESAEEGAAAPEARAGETEIEPSDEAEPSGEAEADDGMGFEEMDFGLTLSGGEEEGEAGATGREEEGEDDFELGMGDLTLEGAPEESEPEEEEARPDPFEMEMGPAAGAEEGPPEEEAADEEEAEDTSFDFGSGPLEVEAGEEEEEEAEEVPEEVPEEGAEVPGEEGMDLESPLDHLGIDPDEDMADSEGFEEDSLVSGVTDEDWSRTEEPWATGPEGLEEPGETGAPPPGEREESGQAGAREGAPDGPPEKRARPARPAARDSSSWGSILTGLVIVAVLAGGGWLGYSFLTGGSDEAVETTGPGPHPRTTRTVPAALEGPFASAADEAVNDVSGWIREVRAAQDVPERPPREWLDGIYLAHASQYPRVREYFTSLRSFMGEVQAQVPERFLEAYDAALAGTGLSPEEQSRLGGWIREDLEWSQFQRDSVYRAVDEVTAAALDLHDLLVERESEIGYELLEAVPAGEDLQSEIDGHVDRLTSALDELNALGEVTTTRFVEILTATLRQTVVPPEDPSSGDAQPQGNS